MPIAECRMSIAEQRLRRDRSARFRVRLCPIRHSAFGTRHSAFTLIEVMVAVTIMAILVVIMSAIFHQSSLAWDSGTGRMKANVTARAVLSLMESELSHAVVDERLKLHMYVTTTGDGDSTIWFWTLGGKAESGERLLRKISYTRNAGAGTLLRQEWTLDADLPYDQAIDGTTGTVGPEPLVLAANVQEILFLGWPDPGSGSQYLTSLPNGVRIRLAMGRSDRVSNLAAWSRGPDGMTNPDKPKGQDENADDIGSW